MNRNSESSVGMGHMVMRRAQMTPMDPALTFEGATQTFEQLAQNIRKVARFLKSLNIEPGDRVGYLGQNHPRFLEVLYASSLLGAIFVPLNYRLSSQEVHYIANDAGLTVLVSDEFSAPLIDEYTDELPCRHFISVGFKSDNWIALDSALANEAVEVGTGSLELAHVAETDTALIMYTSGTTGRPKGALLSHGNIFWNLLNAKFTEEIMRGTTLTCAPLFHIGGLNVTTHPSLVSGVHVILHQAFDAKQVLTDIEKYQVSTMFGAPTMFDMMTYESAFKATDFSSIVAFNCGAAPVPLVLIETYLEKGVQFCQGYGLTETAPYVSVLSSKDSIKKKGSAGKALMFTDVCIVDTSGTVVPAMERGEICVSGPNVTAGYWGLEAATREAFDSNGRFLTGDIGYLDDEGYLFICDRKKDMIISGGENVYPAEVEGELVRLPGVKEVAVVGLPDEKWGEKVVAVAVVDKSTGISIASVTDFLSGKLARYKQPRELHVVDALPRNPAGKVQKFLLKELLIAKA
ncbi:acyl-CoA synthetase [Luminiphilus sp. nBUS_16]|uniref:acyl-CoA synthetase n=1 Tax=Luminiphilus sp. nBUS_16 TaxID=3395315 RepID=UPI003EB81629